MPDLPERDPEPGFSHIRQAIVDLAALQRKAPSGCHGLVIVTLPANAGLLRLSAEYAETLHRDIAWRLAGVLRARDQLYTLSPWEWLAILPSLPSPAAVSLAMLKMHRVFLQSAAQCPHRDPDFQIACGAAACPEHGDDPQHLIQSARIAALNASAANDWSALYHFDMEQRSVHRARLIRQLQEALQKNELQLFLQPQIDLADQRCRHAEALLRWRQPGDGWTNPARIVELLEEAGLRPHFNRWLFQQAALCLARFADVDRSFGLSINLTANDLLDPEVPDLIGQALATWRVSPERLTLEITETAAVREAREVENVLLRLRGLGIRLSIDDFGTGHANMSYLQRMPVQEIKVDKSFIASDTPRNREIARSIMELAHKLGLEVVAEGVETPEILDFLRELACERLQGFLYSPALPLEEFLSWRREFHASERADAA
ncbi:MAG: EAL domain-containing protein [Zoogloeaceae bacterium]|nr:EAL domain-containing protein [Zoogloeaceae bacterium]